MENQWRQSDKHNRRIRMKCSCGNDKFKESIRLISQKNKTALGVKWVCTNCGLEKQEEDSEYEIF